MKTLHRPIARCMRCLAEGTAVEMGICCKVWRMEAESASDRKFDPLPRVRCSSVGDAFKGRR